MEKINCIELYQHPAASIFCLVIYNSGGLVKIWIIFAVVLKSHGFILMIFFSFFRCLQIKSNLNLFSIHFNYVIFPCRSVCFILIDFKYFVYFFRPMELNTPPGGIMAHSTTSGSMEPLSSQMSSARLPQPPPPQPTVPTHQQPESSTSRRPTRFCLVNL